MGRDEKGETSSSASPSEFRQNGLSLKFDKLKGRFRGSKNLHFLQPPKKERTEGRERETERGRGRVREVDLRTKKLSYLKFFFLLPKILNFHHFLKNFVPSTNTVSLLVASC